MSVPYQVLIKDTDFVLALPSSVYIPLQHKNGENTKLVKVHQHSEPRRTVI